MEVLNGRRGTQSMKLVFLADARSAIAINWVRWFVQGGHEVHWVSSRPADPPLEGLASFQVIPLFPELPAGVSVSRSNRLLHPAATILRHWMTPFRLKTPVQALQRLLEDLQPDLLHAMRIPQEGMAAVKAVGLMEKGHSSPVVASVWGDDFTYHAHSSPMMGRLTRETVQKVDGLHTDCFRDIKLAFEWGLRIDTRVIVEPTNGGIRGNLFFPGKPINELVQEYALPKDAFFILNPRGIREVARTDTFFKAIPIVLKTITNAHFLALKMRGSSIAEHWVRRLDIGDSVTLLPPLPLDRMPDLYRLSPVLTSLTEHDGLPNVLLESMACGCFPICGNLESIREWIEDGKNGFLVPPGDPKAAAAAIVRAASDGGLRRKAAGLNQNLIRKRAEWQSVMGRVERFYRALIT
jgi:glycosyltransferase involved in cell wall biosynthesis